MKYFIKYEKSYDIYKKVEENLFLKVKEYKDEVEIKRFIKKVNSGSSFIIEKGSKIESILKELGKKYSIER